MLSWALVAGRAHGGERRAFPGLIQRSCQPFPRRATSRATAAPSPKRRFVRRRGLCPRAYFAGGQRCLFFRGAPSVPDGIAAQASTDDQRGGQGSEEHETDGRHRFRGRCRQGTRRSRKRGCCPRNRSAAWKGRPCSRAGGKAGLMPIPVSQVAVPRPARRPAHATSVPRRRDRAGLPAVCPVTAHLDTRSRAVACSSALACDQRRGARCGRGSLAHDGALARAGRGVGPDAVAAQPIPTTSAAVSAADTIRRAAERRGVLTWFRVMGCADRRIASHRLHSP